MANDNQPPSLDAAGWLALSEGLVELRDALNELSIQVKDIKANADWDIGGKSIAQTLALLEQISKLQGK